MLNLKGKNIFVSGATGFLGRNLVKYFVNTDVNKIVAFSRTEEKQASMRKELDPNQDRIRFILGDIRDLEKLNGVLQDIDIVVHTAALKQVDLIRYNPEEAILINILGTKNIIRASCNNYVEKIIFISSDKACIDYHTRIETDNGIFSIRDIVKNKIQCKVKSYENGKIVYKDILNWYKNKLNNRKLYRLSYKNCAYNIKGVRRRLILTEDHPVFTQNGYKKIVELDKNDKILTDEKCPNNLQMSVLIGCLLGDSSLSFYNYKRKNRNIIKPRHRFLFYHSIHQEEYLKVKYNMLKGLPLSNIKKYGKEKGVEFQIKSSAFLTDIFDRFYQIKNNKKIKIIDKDLFEKYFSPLLMAFWFMDDGCNSGSKSMRLATHCYSFEEVSYLKDFFNKKGFECYIYNCKYKDKIYHELRFTVKGSKELNNYISPYIIPSLRYKLIQENNDFNKNNLEIGEAEVYFDNYILESYKYKTTRDVYCLDIKDTHCFFANGILIHNCLPINLYGATKFAGEQLMQFSHIYQKNYDVKLICCRYGNVAGSTGSVIPYFRKLIKEGKRILPLTDINMSRFWFDVNGAINLIMLSLNDGNDQDIFTPKLSSFYIKDLIKALDCEYEIIGNRGSEKLSEKMINEFENYEEFEDYYIINPKYKKIGLTYDCKDNNFLTIEELKQKLKFI